MLLKENAAFFIEKYLLKILVTIRLAHNSKRYTILGLWLRLYHDNLQKYFCNFDYFVKDNN